MRPQVPPPHPPAVHVPVELGHAAAAARQVLVARLQQPPELQMLPSQHGPPAVPQAMQVELEVRQLRPARVQKFATPELLFGSPLQQAWLVSPQLSVMQPLFRQLPSEVLPQVVLLLTQMDSTQHALPVPEQSLFWQQGAPEVPHATTVPFEHTVAEALA